MPSYLIFIATLGVIGTGVVSTIGIGLFIDSWACGDKDAARAGVATFIIGIISFMAVVTPMFYIADHLKGVQ